MRESIVLDDTERKAMLMFKQIKTLYRKVVLKRTKVQVARALFLECEEQYKKGAMSLQTAAQVCNTTPEAFLFAIEAKKQQETGAS